MTHAEARELLELAAAEPDGLERLGAGDTTESGALAGHLAACDACREEYGRLARTARLLRSSLATLMPTDLRERTLARVAAEGRARGPAAAAQAFAPAPAEPNALPRERAVRPTPVARMPIDRRLAAGWLGSLAAAVAIAVGLSWAVVARPLADASHDRDVAEGLVQLTAATVAIDARPDARRVVLTSSGDAVGTLAFSPSTRQLVVVSTGLKAPAAGQQYRCWVEANGRRTLLGQMYFVGGVAAWDGTQDAVASVADGATFGVSLVPTAGGSDGAPVLVGRLTGT